MDYIGRYQKLNSNSIETTIMQDPRLVDKPMLVFNGFIGDKCTIKPYSDLNVGFRLDDTQMYTEFLKRFSESERNLSTDIANIQMFIDEYFVGKQEGVDKVKQENTNIHSISKYKNNGGICIHKSSVANNLLQILGYDCNMICTNIGSENHAFIILNCEGKSFIYDPTNKSKCFNETDSQGKFNQYFKVPTLVEKSPEEISRFYNNETDLSISDEDETSKNNKQKSGVRIVLPRLTYSCRKNKKYTSLSKNSIVFEYIESLKAKGLTEEEINNLLNRIREDVNQGVTPKVPSLKEVYEEIRKENETGKSR